MFVDASALVAILTQEAGFDTLTDRIEQSARTITSEIAIFEAATAVCRKRRIPIETAEKTVLDFLKAAWIVVVPIGPAEGREAINAFTRFGKGRGHPAQLNMGDCFAYACATTHGVPLLFVGDDFSRTDVPSALP